jgi:hypothetical protein
VCVVVLRWECETKNAAEARGRPSRSRGAGAVEAAEPRGRRSAQAARPSLDIAPAGVVAMRAAVSHWGTVRGTRRWCKPRSPVCNAGDVLRRRCPKIVTGAAGRVTYGGGARRRSAREWPRATWRQRRGAWASETRPDYDGIAEGQGDLERRQGHGGARPEAEKTMLARLIRSAVARFLCRGWYRRRDSEAYVLGRTRRSSKQRQFDDGHG